MATTGNENSKTGPVAPPEGDPRTSSGNIPRGPTPQGGERKVERSAGPRIMVTQLDLLNTQELDPATKEEGRHYRWTRPELVARRKLQGYELEEYRKGGVRTIAEPNIGPDGTIRMGDLVLMSTKTDERKAREVKLHKFNEDRLGAVTDTVKAEAARQGVKVEDTSRMGVE